MSDTFEIRDAEDAPVQIEIVKLKIDRELQCRERTQASVVKEYAEAMTAKTVFPPIDIFDDGESLWLANGFHRVAAAKSIKRKTILARVHRGSRTDALMFAVQADQSVGLRRTNADKRRSIELILRADPKMSGRQIAKLCGVDNKTVEATRQRLKQPESEEVPQPEAKDGEENPQPSATSEASLERTLQKFTRLLGEVGAENRSAFADKVIELLTKEAS